MLLAVVAAYGLASAPAGGAAEAGAPRKVNEDDKAGKPIRALLVIGGCCHDYAKQKDIITKGISERANVQWTVAYEPDKGTRKLNPVYENSDWAKGFDVIVHDECSADVKDPAVIERVLKPHKDGLPAVLLHCAMHSFRGEGYPKATAWFEFTGLPSTGHGPQAPITVTYVDKESPITKGLADWTTINEELYNNSAGKLLDTAKPLARGKQTTKNRRGEEKVEDFVVAWTNTYNGKTRVFGTTLGHNNQTVADAKYLDLVTRGLLWSVDKLDEQHLKPAKQVYLDPAQDPANEKVPGKAAARPGEELLVPVNLARGKVATAASQQDESLSPAAAVDGDLSTRWCAKDDATGYWWQVDLGKPQEVAGCRITWEFDDSPYQYKVEGSTDGKAWATLADETKLAARTQVREHRFEACCGQANPLPGGARYVRITVTGLNPGAWASMYEVEVFGKEMVPASAAKAKSEATDATGGRNLLAGVKVPAEFEVTLFAAPPDVSYPTCVAASPMGEVFVGIDEQGSLGKEAGRGRVVRCVDTDGDGKADRFTTFARMDHPRGVHYDLDGTLYVLHPPFLTAYRDDNGDGVADRSDVLVKGIANEQLQKERGADHTTNGFRLGIDGWIYIAVGDFGAVKAVGKDGGELQMYGGGVARVRTDGSGLEMYSFGQRNIYDVAVDPLLNCFTRDNTNDGGGWDVRLSHVIPTGNYGYPRLFQNFSDEIVQPIAEYGGGSPCGALFVNEPGLPGELRNALLTVEWGRNGVFRHPLQPAGSSFKAKQEPFIEIQRPTDIDVDGQGRFYVSSWINGGFNYSGPNVGYVVQVRPKGHQPAPFPELRKAGDDQLVKYFASPSAVLRQYTQREVLRRGERPAFASGLEKLAKSSEPLAARVAATFTLKQLRGPRANDALASLANKDDVREFALRALADRKGDASAPAALFVRSLKDPNPRVRLQAAWGLARLGKADAAGDLLPLVADADPLVAHVAVNSLVTLRAADAAFGALDSGDSRLLPGALRVLQSLHETRVVDGLVERLGRTQDPAARAQLYKALCRLHYREADWQGKWWGTRPDTSGPYYSTAEWDGTARVKQALRAALKDEKPQVVRGLLVELQRHKVDFEEVPALIASHAAADPAFKAAAVELLSGRAKLDDDQVALLRSAAVSEEQPPALRAKAVAALARGNSESAREAALEAMTLLIAADAAGKLDKALSSLLDEYLRDTKHRQDVAPFAKLTESDAPAQRELGYAVLLNVAARKPRRPGGRAKATQDAAVKVIEKGWEKPVTAASLLRAVGRTRAPGYNDWVEAMLTDPSADVVRAAGFAADRLGMKHKGPAAETRMLIATLSYEKALEMAQQAKGDAKAGQELFTRQGCAACHTVAADEPPKGPFLGGIAARYSPADLAESILKPSARIAQGFETQQLKTADDVLVGFVTRESGDEVEFRNAAGIPTVLKTKDIKSRGERAESVMPEGLVANLTPQELAHLLAYLQSLPGE